MRGDWDQTRQHLRVGDYEQAAITLEQVSRQYTQAGNLAFAHLLTITRHLCLMCLEEVISSTYHQQALMSMANHLNDLSSELLGVVDLLQRMESALPPNGSAPHPENGQDDPDTQHGLWQRLQSLLRRSPPTTFPIIFDWKNSLAVGLSPDLSPGLSPIGVLPAGTNVLADSQTNLLASAAESPTPPSALAVCCLGPFRTFQHDQLVQEWPSRKGKSIFKYLITHRAHPIPKEVLMALLWPDAPPDAARNNLNVAIYGLRQALCQSETDQSHILFQDDCYLINPDLSVWVDVEAFSAHLAHARQLDTAGQTAAAVREYHLAEELYQGDFLEEDRYEDWPDAQRQQIRDAYLDLLDRLSLHYFSQGDDTACILLCRKILGVDTCRESAHYRIMQCYTRQGQRYLAIRQYQICVETLYSDLGISPSPETLTLYQHILNGSAIPLSAPISR